MKAIQTIKRFQAECNKEIAQLIMQHGIDLPYVSLESQKSSTFSSDLFPLLEALQKVCVDKEFFDQLRLRFKEYYDKFIQDLYRSPIHLLFSAFSDYSGQNIDFFNKLKCEEIDSRVNLVKEPRSSQEFCSLVTECGCYLSFYMQVLVVLDCCCFLSKLLNVFMHSISTAHLSSLK